MSLRFNDPLAVQHIFIDSRNAAFGMSESSDDLVFQIPLMAGANQIRLDSLVLTNTIYNVRQGKRQFVFRDLAVVDPETGESDLRVVTLEDGHYDIYSLCQAIQDGMNTHESGGATPTSAFIVEYNDLNGKIEIQCATAFDFKVLGVPYAQQTFGSMIGMDKDTLYTAELQDDTSYLLQAPYIANVEGDNYVFLRCRELSQGESRSHAISPSVQGFLTLNDVLTCIPLADAGFGDVLYHEPKIVRSLDPKNPLRWLSFQLRHADNSIVNLNGGYFMLQFSVYRTSERAEG